MHRKPPSQRLHHALRLVAFALCATGAMSASTAAMPTTVDLAAEASRQAVNDLIRATVAAEASGPTPATPAAEVNRLIAAALKTAQAWPGIKVRSSDVSSYPVYAANSARIEGWRVRSELVLETGDSAALSELLGKLQTTLSVSSLVMQPSPQTRKKAEDEAIVEAIAAFKARAQLVADTLGRPYSIKQLSIGAESRVPQPVMMRAKTMMAAEVNAPIEAGSSPVNVNVAGQIVVE